MASPTSKVLLALAMLGAAAVPAAAQNYSYLDHSDGISIAAGDANAANTAIQTPTPWPWYVNKTTFSRNGQQGADIISNYYKRYSGSSGPTINSTTINVTSPTQ